MYLKCTYFRVFLVYSELQPDHVIILIFTLSIAKGQNGTVSILVGQSGCNYIQLLLPALVYMDQCFIFQFIFYGPLSVLSWIFSWIW